MELRSSAPLRWRVERGRSFSAEANREGEIGWASEDMMNSVCM